MTIEHPKDVELMKSTFELPLSDEIADAENENKEEELQDYHKVSTVSKFLILMTDLKMFSCFSDEEFSGIIYFLMLVYTYII